jgi:hypothetical protein
MKWTRVMSCARAREKFGRPFIAASRELEGHLELISGDSGAWANATKAAISIFFIVGIE